MVGVVLKLLYHIDNLVLIKKVLIKKDVYENIERCFGDLGLNVLRPWDMFNMVEKPVLWTFMYILYKLNCHLTK